MSEKSSNSRSQDILKNFFVKGNVTTRDISQQSIDKQQVNILFFNLSESKQDNSEIIEAINNAYLATVPDTWFDYRDKVTQIDDILKQLEEIPQQNQSHSPLLQFIYLLTEDENIPQTICEKLKQLLSNNSFDTKNNTKSLQPLHSYLLIQLRPEANNQLFLKAWFIPDDTIQDPWERFKPLTVDEQQPEIPFILEELPQLLGNLIQQCFEEHLQGQPTELTIEVFLPRDRLWHEEVEKWKYLDLKYLDSGNTKKKIPSVAIGIRHRVVIRSYERMRKQSKQKDFYWNKKWRKLDWEDSCVNLVNKSPENYSDLDEVRVSLGGKISECEELITFFGETIFLKMFCNLSNLEKDILLDFIESEGIPILIWSRCDLRSFKNSTDFDELMQTKLHELPNYVKKQRVSAQKKYLIAKKQALEIDSSNHLGNHLVLLWDDPNRVPPNQKHKLESSVS